MWKETAADPPRIEAGKDKEKLVGEVELRSEALQKQQKLEKEEEEEEAAMDTALLRYPHAATLIIGIGSHHVCSLSKNIYFWFYLTGLIPFFYFPVSVFFC